MEGAKVLCRKLSTVYPASVEDNALRRPLVGGMRSRSSSSLYVRVSAGPCFCPSTGPSPDRSSIRLDFGRARLDVSTAGNVRSPKHGWPCCPRETGDAESCHRHLIWFFLNNVTQACRVKDQLYAMRAEHKVAQNGLRTDSGTFKAKSTAVR